MRTLGVERADARGAIKLVARDGVEIDVQGPHVDGFVDSTLAAISENRNTLGVGAHNDILQWCDRSKHIRHMNERDQLRARSDRGIQRIDIERTIVADIDPLQHCALPFAQKMPRHDVGMMFHHW